MQVGSTRLISWMVLPVICASFFVSFSACCASSATAVTAVTCRIPLSRCAIGTLIALQLYEKLAVITPDKEKALRYVQQFDYEDWKAQLRKLLGKGAESMIALEAKERKYERSLHEKRLQVILNNWDAILQIIRQELPDAQTLETLLDRIGAPKTLDAIGCGDCDLSLIFKATKDIRDKYVLSRLAWDLGIIEELI